MRTFQVDSMDFDWILLFKVNRFSLTGQDPGKSDDENISLEIVNQLRRCTSVDAGICMPATNQSYLVHTVRTFSNPLSYLGGPHLPVGQRASKESILSIDE